MYHHEKVPSAVERYQKETVRVLGVLNGVLEKQEWLVGGKPTVADFAFVSWNNAGLGTVLVDYPDVNVEKDFPAFWKCVFDLDDLWLDGMALTDCSSAGGTRRSSRGPRLRRSWTRGLLSRNEVRIWSRTLDNRERDLAVYTMYMLSHRRNRVGLATPVDRPLTISRRQPSKHVALIIHLWMCLEVIVTAHLSMSGLLTSIVGLLETR